MAYRRRDREFKRRLCEIADHKRTTIAPKPRRIVGGLREEIARIFPQCVRTIGGRAAWQRQNKPSIFF
jgi:hypothetical protein